MKNAKNTHIKKIDFFSHININMWQYIDNDDFKAELAPEFGAEMVNYHNSNNSFDFEYYRCVHCERILNYDEMPSMNRENPWCSYCGRRAQDDWKCGNCYQNNHYTHVFCGCCYSDRAPNVVIPPKVERRFMGSNCLLNAFINANNRYNYWPGSPRDAEGFLTMLLDLGLANIVNQRTLDELSSNENVGDEALIAIAGLLNVNVIFLRDDLEIKLTDFANAPQITIAHTTNPDHYEFLF